MAANPCTLFTLPASRELAEQWPEIYRPAQVLDDVRRTLASLPPESMPAQYREDVAEKLRLAAFILHDAKQTALDGFVAGAVLP